MEDLMPKPKSSKKYPLHWKTLKSADEACELLDSGVLLMWKDVPQAYKALDTESQKHMIRHGIKRLGERLGDRLSSEIIVETMMLWLAHDHALVQPLLQQILEEPHLEKIVKSLVEIALTCESYETQHEEKIHTVAVGVICELGLSLQVYHKTYPEDIEHISSILSHMTTYLLSVSNQSHTATRLCLLHYFGFTAEQNPKEQESLNRIMNRFGHTALDHLFNMLFQKKTEGIALQFLLENLPHVFLANAHVQSIMHETLKFYMLKQPEKFSLFLSRLSEEISKKPTSLQFTFLQHIGMLFGVSSEVHHKALALELTELMGRYPKALTHEIYMQLQHAPGLRPTFKHLIKRTLDYDSHTLSGPKLHTDVLGFHKASKRGRKPVLTRIPSLSLFEQVRILSTPETPTHILRPPALVE
jgi:hypothetical protein